MFCCELQGTFFHLTLGFGFSQELFRLKHEKSSSCQSPGVTAVITKK